LVYSAWNVYSLLNIGKKGKREKITQNKVKFALDNNRNRIFADKIIVKGAEKFI